MRIRNPVYFNMLLWKTILILIADSRFVLFILVTVLFLSVLCRGEEDYPTALERGCRALSSLAHHSQARRCDRIFRVTKKNKLFRILVEICIKNISK
jgi:hypothetical protein